MSWDSGWKPRLGHKGLDNGYKMRLGPLLWLDVICRCLPAKERLLDTLSVMPWGPGEERKMVAHDTVMESGR